MQIIPTWLAGIASLALLLLILGIAAMEFPILLLVLIDKLISLRSKQGKENSPQSRSSSLQPGEAHRW